MKKKIKEVLFMRIRVRVPTKHHMCRYGRNFAHCACLGAVFKECSLFKQKKEKPDASTAND